MPWRFRKQKANKDLPEFIIILNQKLFYYWCGDLGKTKFTCFEFGVIVKISENLLSAFGYTKTKRKSITEQSLLPIAQQDCPGTGWFPALAMLCSQVGWPVAPHSAAKSSCGAGSSLCLQITACWRSKQRLQLFSLQKPCHNEAQGAEHLTQPVSETRFCLGSFELTLTHPFWPLLMQVWV